MKMPALQAGDERLIRSGSTKWPRRLAIRISGSRPEDPGLNPGEAAKRSDAGGGW